MGKSVVKYKYYIVISNGYWGGGENPTAAKAHWKDVGGKGNWSMYQFTSNLPFAPADRDATKDEAEAWVNRYGSLVMKRCSEKKLAQCVDGIVTAPIH
jgi:hypothetical protein